MLAKGWVCLSESLQRQWNFVSVRGAQVWHAKLNKTTECSRRLFSRNDDS